VEAQPTHLFFPCCMHVYGCTRVGERGKRAKLLTRAAAPLPLNSTVLALISARAIARQKPPSPPHDLGQAFIMQ
jgi:hypothetical protein